MFIHLFMPTNVLNANTHTHTHTQWDKVSELLGLCRLLNGRITHDA